MKKIKRYYNIKEDHVGLEKLSEDDIELTLVFDKSTRELGVGVRWLTKEEKANAKTVATYSDQRMLARAGIH